VRRLAGSDALPLKVQVRHHQMSPVHRSCHESVPMRRSLKSAVRALFTRPYGGCRTCCRAMASRFMDAVGLISGFQPRRNEALTPYIQGLRRG